MTNSVKYILVTGAAKGIGQATALHLAKQGFHVFAGVRKVEDGAALQAQAGASLTPVLLDVTVGEQIAATAQQIGVTVGGAGLYGVVNNAGMAVPAPLEFVPLDELRRQLEINVIGQVAVTQALLPLVRQAKGRIVNVSSIGGRLASPLMGPYNMSKFAVEAMTDVLRQELQADGIAVVAILPGAVATPIWGTATATADQLIAAMPPAMLERYGKMIEGVRKFAANGAKNGAPPQLVADAIALALTAARPRTRYVVGRDARFAARFVAPLPDRWRDRLMASR